MHKLFRAKPRPRALPVLPQHGQRRETVHLLRSRSGVTGAPGGAGDAARSRAGPAPRHPLLGGAGALQPDPSPRPRVFSVRGLHAHRDHPPQRHLHRRPFHSLHLGHPRSRALLLHSSQLLTHPCHRHAQLRRRLSPLSQVSTRSSGAAQQRKTGTRSSSPCRPVPTSRWWTPSRTST